jgi:hypothetical protein
MSLAETKQNLAEFLASDADYLWIVDARVLWEDMEEEFQLYFEESNADLLATEIRTFREEPQWTWWKSLISPSNPNSFSECVAAALSLARLSRDAAKVIIKGIEDGWSGHPEGVIPTLVNMAGLVIEDIGGTGSFTPPDRIGRWYDRRTWHWRGPVEYVPGKLHFPLLSRYHAQAPEELAPEPRVSFLFLTRGDVHQQTIWEEYLEQAGHRARVFAHTKDVSLLRTGSILINAQIKQKVITEWASLSLVHATLALLRCALEDCNSSHFMLVSESCVPVRPFEDLLVNLRRDDRSRMHVWPLSEVKRGGDRDKANRLEQLSGITSEHAYFQSQWMCLSREDALIVTEKDWTPSFENVYAADECYFATVLAASGKPPPEAVAVRPITWTDWRGGAHPVEYHQVLPRTAARIAESGCYFARKFAPDSDVGKWGLHRESRCRK